jgi:ATPase subunit of ABC transporter with duplicated ATPase domains
MAAPPIVSVHLRGVTFSHSSAVPVLSDVTLDLGPGRHGLVGANGAGKSTLLDLVDGSRAPSPGDVTVVADGPVVRLRQDPDDLSDEIARFGQRWDGDAVALRRLLDLDVDDLWQWDTRSPGRRMQWQVAAALAVDPDVLLLDEPTNHLDAHARDLLVTALDRARVPLLVVVSHDRAVLDRLTSSTLRVVDGTVQQWAGSWTGARRRWEADEAAARDAHDAARRRAGRARSLLAASRSRLSGVERGAAASRRAAGAADSDTRSAATGPTGRL